MDEILCYYYYYMLVFNKFTHLNRLADLQFLYAILSAIARALICFFNFQ